MRQIYFLILLLISTVNVHAEIYFWVDKNGVKHFSDRPPQGKESSAKSVVSIQKDTSKNINLMAPPPRIPSYQPSGKPKSNKQTAVISRSKGSHNSGNTNSQKKNKNTLQSNAQTRNAYRNSATNYNQTHPNNKVAPGHNKQARILTAQEGKKDKLNKKSKKKLKDKLKSYNASKKKSKSKPKS